MNKEKTVLVTGATGYIASWVVKYLLEEGYTVHATVRDKNKRVEYLKILSDKYSDKLYLFNADLLEKGSFKEAMQGCEAVIHMASPFVISKVKDAEKELIQPALEGTRNVLESVNETESVKKVVLTSSVGAIYCDAIDIEDTRNEIFTEENWNTVSSPTYQPYQYSKKIAEKEAWKIDKSQNRWKLAVINPGFVLGPSLTDRNDSASIDFMLSLMNGKLRIGVPELYTSIVDVRDVAKAHIKAFENDNISGRYIVVNESHSMKKIADILLSKYSGKYPIPKNILPKTLMYLLGPFVGFSWKGINRNIGIAIKFDNTKSKKELGISYIELEKTVLEHAEQIINSGLLAKK